LRLGIPVCLLAVLRAHIKWLLAIRKCSLRPGLA
jgi:hypothetical protein